MAKLIGVQVANRRDFLTGAAGLTLVLAVAPDTFMGEASADAPLSPNQWLTTSPSPPREARLTLRPGHPGAGSLPRASGPGRGRNESRHGRLAGQVGRGAFCPSFASLYPRKPKHVRVHRKRKLRFFPNSRSTIGHFAAMPGIARSSLKNRFPGRKNGRLISW
jgi:hypothetical protein